MSFAEKLKTSRSELLYLVRGKDKGKACWHYILVKKAKLPLFERAVKQDMVELADFGQVLASGWGQNPPEDIAAKIKADFS